MANPCANPANEIVAENCLGGHPATEWDINGYGDPSIQGFGTEIAVAQGESIDFKVDTDSDDYRIDIYRMGYYGGMGARRVDSVEPSAALPQVQPECLRGAIPVLAEGGGLDTWPAPLVDCGNWAVSASWRAPEDATSGIYFARLVREDPVEGWVKNDRFAPSPLPPTGRDSLWEADGFRAVMRNALREPRASHVYFVVRDDDGRVGSALPDFGPDLAGVQPLRRTQRVRPAQPGAAAACTAGSRARPRSATTGPSRRGTTGRSTCRSTPNTRWCAGWSGTATT